ncbi:MAG: nucleotidyltransferase family protein, partial [Caldilineaceae bacterium]
MTTSELIIPTEELVAFCKSNQITYLGLFGSAARGAMRPDSDVDILVEWAPERR